MKILLITDTHNLQKGGAEKYFFTLKEKLKAIPSLEVWSLGFNGHNEHGKDFIILKETPSKFWRQFWRMFFNPRKFWQLRQAIKKINPDIIHLHNIKKYTPALLAAVKPWPVVQTVHDFSLICPTQWNVHKNLQPCATGFQTSCSTEHQRDYSFLEYAALVFSFKKMRRHVKKVVRHFIAPSECLMQFLQTHHFTPVTTLIPFHHATRIPATENPDPHHFLFIGQLEKQKGVDVLIREFALAVAKNTQLTLTIAGTGSERKNLQEKIIELNLTHHIQLVGRIERPEIFYQQCAALIFPSIGLESFGLVISEAMSHARPVIGSNRGPTCTLVEDQKTGLLFDPLKPGDLAEKILWIAQNPAQAKLFGLNGFEKVERFMKDAEIVHCILEIYHDVSKQVASPAH